MADIDYQIHAIHTKTEEIIANIGQMAKEAVLRHEIDVDWEAVNILSQYNRCLAICAYKDKEMLGSIVVVISEDLNHKHVKQAQIMVLFIKPQYRGNLSKKLLAACDGILKELGIQEITCLAENARLWPFLNRNGFRKVAEQWAKTI